MHLFDGFTRFENNKKPTELLIKAIKEAQIFILEQNRDDCPICRMLALKMNT